MPDVPALDAADDDALRNEPVAASPISRERELEALYRTHYTRVVGYFLRCGQSQGVAVELAQDTFVSALRGLADFRGQSKLSTWLWTIARNVLLGHVRTPRPLDVADHDDELIDGLTDSPAPHLKDDCLCVRRGFALFSRDHPERAQVLYLAIVEGWTREELAEHLGRSTHAATEYLSQCKAKFRPYVENCREA
jgi:RNA polymerase sigma-70 factor (ECF subfamily)